MDYELNRQGVRRVSYDSATSEMRIEFMRGQVYAYDAVPESIVTWLVRTKDPAGYIQRVITPGFAYRKVRSLGTAQGSKAMELSPDEELEARLRASLAKVGVKEPFGR
jgi:hypothetical protein